MIDQGGLLELADRLPIGELPEAYREGMRLYLALGVRPGDLLELLLEGAAAGCALGSGELAEVARWIERRLPAYAHGNRDQVGLFTVYVRRARGRALLAAMEGELPECPCPVRSPADPSRTTAPHPSSSPPSSGVLAR